MRVLGIPTVVVASLQFFVLLLGGDYNNNNNNNRGGVVVVLAKIWETFPLDDEYDDIVSTGEDTEWFDFDDVTFDFEYTETKTRLADYLFDFELPELNYIDLDQIEIKDRVDGATDESLGIIRNIYERGGHSKPVATLLLAAPLEFPLERFSFVEGTTAGGLPVKGTLPDGAPEGATILAVVYDRDADDHTGVYAPRKKPPCSVGGLPDPNLEGCLVASGTIEIKRNDVLHYVPVAEQKNGTTTTTMLRYQYDPNTDNKNLRTLQSFSTEAHEKYWNCNNSCPHEIFRTYVDYYGFPDYADQWIQAFLSDESTNLMRGNRLKESSGYRGSNTPVARAEAVATATVAMSTWMAVIGQLHAALVRCGDCPDGLCHHNHQQDKRAVRELEKAAALYTGSAEGLRSLYQLGDEGSFIFNTREDLNREILGRMQSASGDLSRGLCRSARDRVAEIEKFMIVLLLQGLIRSAYVLSSPKAEQTLYELTYDISYHWRTTTEMVWGQAEAFSAAVLPLIYQQCTIEAGRLYDEMFDSHSPSWETVKRVVGRVSECLDITPDELGTLGGLWNRDEETERDSSATEPCNNCRCKSIQTLAIAVLVVVAVGSFCTQLKNKFSTKKVEHVSTVETGDEEP